MRVVAFVFGLLCTAFAMQAAEAGNFSDWAALVVAGDWHSHSGAPSKVFDNARNDIASALVRVGFSQDHIGQFTVGPDHQASNGWARSDKQSIANELWDLSNRATTGCLVYFTSHGSPDGIVIDEGLLSPAAMNMMIDNACGSRPTVVFIAACFSGVFIDPLAAPNRLVMTAARPDRPSFGCGDNDHYTFFDNCWLDSIGGVGDFGSLANAIKGCVSRKEAEIHALPSEPQLSIGQQLTKGELAWR